MPTANPTRLTPKQLELLDILSSDRQPQEIRVLAYKTQRSYNTVARDVRLLVKVKCVKRVASNEGHKFLYKYITHEAKFPELKPNRPPVDPLSLSAIIGIASKWVESGWNPAITDRINALPHTVGRLMELDALASIEGEVISDSELKELRTSLEELLRLYENGITLLRRLLETKLWTKDSLYGFFTSHVLDKQLLLTNARLIQRYAATLSDDDSTYGE